MARWKAHRQGSTAVVAVPSAHAMRKSLTVLKFDPSKRPWRAPRAPRDFFLRSGGCLRRYRSQWNALGQLSAPIPSLRSYAAYRPAARCGINRQMACPRRDNGSGACVGYPRTLRARSCARKAGDSAVLCVAVGTVETVVAVDQNHPNERKKGLEARARVRTPAYARSLTLWGP